MFDLKHVNQERETRRTLAVTIMIQFQCSSVSNANGKVSVTQLLQLYVVQSTRDRQYQHNADFVGSTGSWKRYHSFRKEDAKATHYGLLEITHNSSNDFYVYLDISGR